MHKDPDFTKRIALEVYADMEHAVPYIYQLQLATASVAVFGADHSNVPEQQQFSALEALFYDMNPQCVLIEGIQDEVLFSKLHELIASLTYQESIIRGGESLAAAWLAHQNGQTWQSMEPTDYELLQYLSGLNFSRQEIVVWSVMRLLPQYVRREPNCSFVEYVQPFMEQTARAVWWSEAQQAPSAVLAAAVELLGHDVSLHSEEQAVRYVSPLATVSRDGDYGVLNTLSAVANEYRDRVMVERMLRSASYYSRVLVVYGASHAVIQEPILRDVCGE